MAGAPPLGLPVGVKGAQINRVPRAEDQEGWWVVWPACVIR